MYVYICIHIYMHLYISFMGSFEMLGWNVLLILSTHHGALLICISVMHINFICA